MMRRWHETYERVLAAGVLVCCAGPAAGHDGLHEQIAAVTARIAEAPTDAALYLKRGELHRLHRAWDAAFVDFERAAGLEPELEAVELARGRLFLDAGWPGAALIHLDRFLATHPEHGPALLGRARALAGLAQPGEAASVYDRALERLERHLPEHYIERAGLRRAAGDPERALAGLDEGVGRLGPVVQIQLEAIELEIALGRVDAALARLDPFLEGARRKEPWLARRAAILEAAGRLDDAAEHYRRALEAIEALPERHRHLPATVGLRGRVVAALDRLSAVLDSERQTDKRTNGQTDPS